ncbi:hypothetical protein [Actinoplanes sp. NPDC049118]|uniref:hypothetical protein n=1 Tax=Actinoplanes sp. NPDC049118 TaxID=3155769 RepID=UPI0033F93949
MIVRDKPGHVVTRDLPARRAASRSGAGGEHLGEVVLGPVSAASRDPAYGEQVFAMTVQLLERAGLGTDRFRRPA